MFMSRFPRFLAVAAVAGTCAQAAAQVPVAQVAPPPAAPPPASRPHDSREPGDARYQIRVMERVLESAVQHGAQVVTRQVRQVSPELLAFTGPARARGYRLEDYGVFFSVEVPAVRRSVAWSMRTLQRSGPELSRALDTLRRSIEAQSDVRARRELQQALSFVELQVGPLPSTPAAPAPAAAAARLAATEDAARGAGRSVERSGPEFEFEAPPAAVRDPGAAYEAEVKAALATAMLDYSGTLDLRPGDWLTVAARDNDDRLLTDLTESVTIVLRVRASDLSAWRSGQITREQAMARVEVREF
jgi:hypothetical protein